MTQPIELRGLPTTLSRDAWWLNKDPGPIPTPRNNARESNRFPKKLALLVLVAFGDVLFWDVKLGLSLALFAYVLFFMATIDISPKHRLLGPVLLVVLGSLPTIEFVQPLSLAFLGGSFVVALVWARNDTKNLWDLAEGMWSFACNVPEHFMHSAIRSIEIKALKTNATPMTSGFLRHWAFPLGGGLVFGGLLLMANPVLLKAVSVDIQAGELLARGLFWLGVAFLCTPFLAQNFEPVALPTLPTAFLDRDRRLGLNPASCLRALWTFNALIAVQTLMDFSIFIGGASLPEGMTYASYAHRGSYPLLATALLAGGFALMARPFLNEQRALKPLMFLWLAQNILLCLSAILRLDLYVDTYGLTYLRIYAMIWIGLVAAGLVLVAWQAKLEKSNTWLFATWSALATIVLFTCCFINFANVIVHQNLTMDRPDFDYICTLNPTARGSLGHPAANGLSRLCPINQLNTLDNWQEWGFRNWRSGLYDNSKQVLAENMK